MTKLAQAPADLRNLANRLGGWLSPEPSECCVLVSADSTHTRVPNVESIFSLNIVPYDRFLLSEMSHCRDELPRKTVGF